MGLTGPYYKNIFQGNPSKSSNRATHNYRSMWKHLIQKTTKSYFVCLRFTHSIGRKWQVASLIKILLLWRKEIITWKIKRSKITIKTCIWSNSRAKIVQVENRMPCRSAESNPAVRHRSIIGTQNFRTRRTVSKQFDPVQTALIKKAQ